MRQAKGLVSLAKPATSLEPLLEALAKCPSLTALHELIYQEHLEPEGSYEKKRMQELIFELSAAMDAIVEDSMKVSSV